MTRKWAPAIGGMETWSHRLSEELSDHEPVAVIALPGQADGSRPTVGALLAFPLTVLRRWFARDETARVLHIGDMALWPVGLLAMLFAPQCRIVLSAHGTDISYSARGGLRGRLYGAYQRIGAALLGARATVVSNSAATAAAARRLGWNRGPIIPLGTDFRPAIQADARSNEILFAGRRVTRKGCEWFVRNVLPMLPDDITLAIAGPGWDAAGSQFHDNPRIRMCGGLNPAQLASAYAQALCVIVPNIDLPNGEFEGFGLVAPEAAAAGGVVLAAATGGLTEAVRDGETGILLPPGNAEEWAQAVRAVQGWSAQDRAAFIAKSLRAVDQHYRWDRVARDTLAVYAVPVSDCQD